MLVKVEQAFLDEAKRRIEDWLDQNAGTSSMVQGALHHLTLPVNAAPAPLGPGYELGVLIEEMAYAHAVRGKSSAEDKRPPVTTMAKAPETERNSWYIVCRILHDCLPAVAIALMERGDAVQTEVATV